MNFAGRVKCTKNQYEKKEERDKYFMGNFDKPLATKFEDFCQEWNFCHM